MNGPRQLGQSSYLALKAAYRSLLRAAGGPVAASSYTRGSVSMLSRYGSTSEDMFAPLDVIADMEAEADDPIVARALADQAGYKLVKRTEATATCPNLLGHFAALVKESADVMTKLAACIGDGDLSPTEAREVLVELGEMQTQAANLRADLERIAHGTTVTSLVPRRVAGE